MSFRFSARNILLINQLRQRSVSNTIFRHCASAPPRPALLPSPKCEARCDLTRTYNRTRCRDSANIKRAIPTLSREAVISFLSRAGTGELVEVILDALQQNPATKPQKDSDCEARVVLAQVFRRRVTSRWSICWLKSRWGVMGERASASISAANAWLGCEPPTASWFGITFSTFGSIKSYPNGKVG